MVSVEFATFLDGFVLWACLSFLVASCDIPLDGGYHHIHIIWQHCPTLGNISYIFLLQSLVR